MEAKMHLFIVGGTGVLGGAAANFFLERKYKVSVLVRDKSKASDLENAGARIVVGDITNQDDIQNLFEGVDIVLTAVHGFMSRGKNKSENVDHSGHKYLIDEALRCGVKQFIYTSAANISIDHPVDFYRTKFKIEAYLKNSGLNYTILRLPAFMEWHAYNLLGKSIVENGKVTILGKGENPLNFIAVRDVVAALGKMVLNSNYFNEVVIVGGPENLSRNEVAQRFGKALNIEPKIRHVSTHALKLFSVLFQPLHSGMARVMKYSLYTENSNEKLDEKYTVARFGIEPTTLDEFIGSITGNPTVDSKSKHGVGQGEIYKHARDISE